MNSTKYKGRPWSYGIIAAIGIFMLGTISMVVIFVSQDVEVLYPDYYERTLNYDGVQARLSEALKDENQIRYQLNTSKDSLFLHFVGDKLIKGSVALIKPNNSKQDKDFTFDSKADQSIMIPIADLEKGLWNVEIEWKHDKTDVLTRFKILL